MIVSLFLVLHRASRLHFGQRQRGIPNKVTHHIGQRLIGIPNKVKHHIGQRLIGIWGGGFWSVASMKLQVSFAKEPYKRDNNLQSHWAKAEWHMGGFWSVGSMKL